jgi:tRNA uridine 5-carboxymethylaminomethyl modification enzyme
LLKKNAAVESLISMLRATSVKIGEIDDYLISVREEPLTQGKKLYDIVLRSNVTIADLSREHKKLGKFISEQGFSKEVIEQAEIQCKYRGYIERERYYAEKMHRLESIAIPESFDFNALQSLTIEARQKLTRIRPTTIGQASRIPGVSPADINVLLVKFGR